MEFYQVELSPDAAESFRGLELLERQAVWDLLDNFRVGRFAEEDYNEMTQAGRLQSVIIVSRSAVTFVPEFQAMRVRIISVKPADRG